MSELFKLNLRDLGKGCLTALIAGVLFAIFGAFNQPGFDVFSADWNVILQNAVNAAIAALVGYLGKQLVSDSNGKVFGRI